MLLLLSACVLGTTTTTGRFDGDADVTSAVVHVPTGDVRVDGDPALTTAHARWTLTFAGDEPTVTSTITDGVLTVRVECGEAAICGADVDVAVPAGVPVRLEADTGDVTAVGLTGELTASVGTGDVVLESIGGVVVLAVDTGDIDGTALTADLEADLATGDASLEWTSPANITIDAATGDLDLFVPAGAYALDLGVATGDVEVSGVQDDADAAHAIHAFASTGDVTVTGT